MHLICRCGICRHVHDHYYRKDEHGFHFSLARTRSYYRKRRELKRDQRWLREL